jgi:hypothetical protein
MSYVAVSDMHSAGAYHAPAHEYEAIVHAVESGAEWLRFTTTDGADVMLRTSTVLAVTYLPDAAIAAMNERDARDRIA